MSDLAPGPGHDYKQDKKDTCIEDPFATPASLSSPSPTIPQQCAFPPSNVAPPRIAAVSGGWSTIHDRYGSKATSIPYKPGSMSSAGDSTLMSMDLEKASLAKEQDRTKRSTSQESKRSKRSRGSKGSRASRDPEKAMTGRHSNSHPSIQHNASNTAAYLEDEELDEGQQVQDKKALKILLFMSGPCVLLSAINTAWACIALVITALSQPIRLCAKRPTFGQQLAGLLGPTLNLQLRCIYTPLPPYANEDATYHTFMLAVVHLLSPFLSFVLMFAAWTLGVYWISSQIVGDPAGQDKRDDGKEAVLGLRRWWERWLLRSVKEE